MKPIISGRFKIENKYKDKQNIFHDVHWAFPAHVSKWPVADKDQLQIPYWRANYRVYKRCTK